MSTHWWTPVVVELGSVQMPVSARRAHERGVRRGLSAVALYGGVTDPSKTPSAYLLSQPGRHGISNVYDTENFPRRTASELTKAPPVRFTQ